MTIVVSITEAKSRLQHLLAAVDIGEDVIITRRGKPVARLELAGQMDGPERDIAQLKFQSHAP